MTKSNPVNIDKWSWDTYGPHPNAPDNAFRDIMKKVRTEIDHVKLVSEAFQIVEKYCPMVNKIMDDYPKLGTCDPEVGRSVASCFHFILYDSENDILRVIGVRDVLEMYWKEYHWIIK